MSSVDIVSNQNYLSPSRYISGRIIEYDIRAANISILRDRNIISEDRYIYLKNLPKYQREVEIGLMEKEDLSIYTQLQEGIINAKKDLVSFNKIDEDKIIRVANDAIYLNSEIDLKYTKFGDYIEFAKKSEYSTYCKLDNIIVLLKFLDSGNINLDIKGLDSTGRALEIHKNYMISIIVSTIALLERSGIQSAIDYLSEVCKKYITRELPVEYYREFNKDSKYSIIELNSFSAFSIDYIADNSDISYIDISYNYSILRELWSILLEIYSIRKR